MNFVIIIYTDFTVVLPVHPWAQGLLPVAAYQVLLCTSATETFSLNPFFASLRKQLLTKNVFALEDNSLELVVDCSNGYLVQTASEL